MPKKNLQKTFNEVRKAYRFLYDYQRQILSIVGQVGEDLHLDYCGGYPFFSLPSPGFGAGKLQNWSWDWLNMYTYEFHFQEWLRDGNRYRLSLFLVSDTGYYDQIEKKASDITDSEILKLDPGVFEKSSKSSTLVLFLCGRNLWHDSFPEFRNFFSKAKQDSHFLFSPSSDASLLISSIGLTSFWEEDDVRLKTEAFANLLSENGFILPDKA